MRVAYIAVREISGGQVFEACHQIDLNHHFMQDAEALDYFRTTLKELSIQVSNAVYQHLNSRGIANKSDQPTNEG